MDECNLIKANEDDCELLYRWANESEVRKNSFNTNELIYEEHMKWFKSKLNSKDTSIYIFENKQEAIGVIRLEKIANEILLINYSIDSNYRGKGYATKLLEIIKMKFDNYILIGKVKKDNIGSIKAFQNSGYFMKQELDYLEFYSKN